MNLDLDTIQGALATWKVIVFLVGLLVFFFVLVRGKMSMVWMKRRFVERKK